MGGLLALHEQRRSLFPHLPLEIYVDLTFSPHTGLRALMRYHLPDPPPRAVSDARRGCWANVRFPFSCAIPYSFVTATAHHCVVCGVYGREQPLVPRTSTTGARDPHGPPRAVPASQKQFSPTAVNSSCERVVKPHGGFPSQTGSTAYTMTTRLSLGQSRWGKDQGRLGSSPRTMRILAYVCARGVLFQIIEI